MPDNKHSNLVAKMRPKGKAEQPAYNAGTIDEGLAIGSREYGTLKGGG